MYSKKSMISLIVLWVFITQIVFTNVSILSTNAAETVIESVYSNQTSVESNIIGDVNGDEEINSVDFALMRKVLLGLISNFPISNGEWASDIDGNGIFNSIDFAVMRKYLLGIINFLPVVVDEIENPFRYAIFSGDTENDLLLYGDSLEIYGDIHSNSGISIYTNSNSHINGECSAANAVNSNGIVVHKSLDAEKNVIIPMPDLSAKFEIDAKGSMSYFSNNIDYSGKRWIDYIVEGPEGCISTYLGENIKCSYSEALNADGFGTWELSGESLVLKKSVPLFFDGNVKLSIDNISGCGLIIARGDIVFNNGKSTDLGLKYKEDGTVDLENSSDIGFYSIGGNIHFNMVEGAKFKGLVYAPGSVDKPESGYLQLNTYDLELYGSVVSNKLEIGGIKKIRYANTEIHKMIKYDALTE